MSNNEGKNLDLKDIRNEIDVIDKELVDLFEKRMKLCRDVAEFKFRTGKNNSEITDISFRQRKNS